MYALLFFPITFLWRTACIAMGQVVTLAEAIPAPGPGMKLPLDLHAIGSRCSNAYCEWQLAAPWCAQTSLLSACSCARVCQLRRAGMLRESKMKHAHIKVLSEIYKLLFETQVCGRTTRVCESKVPGELLHLEHSRAQSLLSPGTCVCTGFDFPCVQFEPRTCDAMESLKHTVAIFDKQIQDV